MTSYRYGSDRMTWPMTWLPLVPSARSVSMGPLWASFIAETVRYGTLLLADRRQDFPDPSAQDGVCHLVERRRLGVDDHHAGAAGPCRWHRGGDWVNLQARADRQQQIGRFSRQHRAFDDARHQRLAERDRRALEDPAAFRAGRILFARAQAIEHRAHRAAPAAVHAHDVVDGAMHLDHEIG